MKIRKKLNKYGAFSVDNVFVREIMGKLSGNGVKLYIYMLYLRESGAEMMENYARTALRFSEAEFKSAMADLINCGALSYDSYLKTYELASAEEMETFQDKSVEYRALSDKDAAEYNEVARTINEKFFAGRMASSWLTFMDKCRFDYGFEPETIYLLFSHCGDKATSQNYVAKVAENWMAEKIVTPEDVDARMKEFEFRIKYEDFIKQKINFRRNLNEAERILVTGWYKSNITLEMLDVLLSNTNRIKGFTIGEIDRNVQEWLKNNITTKEGVEEFLKSKAKENKPAYGGKNNGNNSGSPVVHPDSERKYDDSVFDNIGT